MDNELPQHLFHTSTSISHNPTRKRLRHNSFNAPSSDPPIFSSDDNPDADNYLYGREQRKKKKFRGPWYQQVLQSETGSQDEIESTLPPKRMGRKFERKYDSGVYMGSDGTEIEEEFLEHAHTSLANSSALSLRQTRTASRPQPERSQEEIWVQGRIQTCLEEGNERIDLSGQGLSTITNATIRPLATFATIPPVSQDVFQHLEPRLKIFLSSNNLTSLPQELFHLERLTALSLRGNRLRELSPLIGKLTNLKELNISLNRLAYLPFEILDLFSDTCHLSSLNIHPNPFLQPRDPSEAINDAFFRKRRGAISYSSPCERRRLWSPRWMISFQLRSDVRYFDKYGTLIKGPAFERQGTESSGQDDHSIPVADLTITPEPPTSQSFTTRAPSLVEVALKSCLQSPQLPQLPAMLYEGLDHLHGLLEQAAAQKESGVGKCTICQRKFVIKRTEWIEWWEISMVQDGTETAMGSVMARNERDVLESKVPLVRRGCSWSCVPKKVVAAEEALVDSE